MPKHSGLCAAFLMLAPLGPSLAQPVQKLNAVSLSSIMEGRLEQIDNVSGITVRVLNAAKLQRGVGPHTPALLAAIAAWLSADFGMSAVQDPPRVMLVPLAKLEMLRFGGLLPDRATHVDNGGDRTVSWDREYDVVALYDDATQTIYVQEGWTGATPAELSVLVHEMAHHLQNLAGSKYRCAEARERPAYVAQARWLALFGKSLGGEFSIDPMTLLVRTACTM